MSELALREARLLPLNRSFLRANVGSLQINYTPTRALYRVENDALRSNQIVKRLIVAKRLDNTPSDILRWKVVSHIASKHLPLSTQRNRLRRQWTSAFTEALRRQGIRADGRAQQEGARGLVGTLEILTQNAYGFDHSPEKLASEADKIVDALLKAGTGAPHRTYNGGGSNG